MNVHAFACDDGVHIRLWRLNLYWFRHGVSRYWRPWKSDVDGSVYFLRFCVEWRRAT